MECWKDLAHKQTNLSNNIFCMANLSAFLFQNIGIKYPDIVACIRYVKWNNEDYWLEFRFMLQPKQDRIKMYKQSAFPRISDHSLCFNPIKMRPAHFSNLIFEWFSMNAKYNWNIVLIYLEFYLLQMKFAPEPTVNSSTPSSWLPARKMPPTTMHVVTTQSAKRKSTKFWTELENWYVWPLTIR